MFTIAERQMAPVEVQESGFDDQTYWMFRPLDELLELDVRQVIVLSIEGGFGGKEAGELGHRMAVHLRQGHRAIIVDLRRVRWIDSQGMGWLIKANSILMTAGGLLAVVNASKRLKYQFAQLRLV